MFDLISIGDCVIDTYIPIKDAKIESQKGQKELVIHYGEKVPVGPPVSTVGGNATNDAIGAHRLGLKTAIYTNIGNDEEAIRILQKLKAEKIDTRYVHQNDDLASNHNVVLDYRGDRTILIYHQPWKYELPDLDRTKFIYLTSLSPSYLESPILNQLVNFLERTHSRLVFNPGTYQIEHGAKKCPKLLFLTEAFIVNLEEAKIFLGLKAEKKVEVIELMKQIADLGVRKIVITDGGNGSFGFDGENIYKLGVFPAELVEMTGAGDAYASGTMAGLFYNQDLGEAMRWGAANSSSVVEHIGPQQGLLTFDQMQKKLRDNRDIIAKVSKI